MGIFSTYRQGENRVTATLLAVLEELSIKRLDTILGAFLEDSEFRSITFINQPSKGHEGVPDASIIAGANILFETKLYKDQVHTGQLQRHLASLDISMDVEAGSTGFWNVARRNHKLIVLTPDLECPNAIDECNSQNVVWASFQKLFDTIDEILDDKLSIVSERESFLLRELQSLLQNSDLLAKSEDDTLIIPAGRSNNPESAWNVYAKSGIYACQPNRSFKKTDYLAFYADGEIKPTLARIVKVYEEVALVRENEDPALGEAIDRLLLAKPAFTGSTQKLLVLEPLESKHNILLPTAIVNDKKTDRGKGTAFTQNQTYADSKVLLKSKYTSDLANLASSFKSGV